MRYLFALVLSGLLFVTLSGCPCGTQTLPVTLTPIDGEGGYTLEGPYNFTGTLTKENAGDAEWLLEGTFAFTTSGYTVLAPNIEVRESFPEQVEVTMRVVTPAPDAVLLPVITEVPVMYSFAASDEASIEVQVREVCWSLDVLAQ